MRATRYIKCCIAVLLVLPEMASAHGSNNHRSNKSADAQMRKLHAIMPMFSIASAELELALEKGDAAVAKSKADLILAAIPDLKKSRPHKNIKRLKSFVNIASNLEETITFTAVMAGKGDFVAAKAAFKNAEKACSACHEKFRD